MAHDRKTTHKDVNHNLIKQELETYGYEVDDVCSVPGLYDVVVTGIPSWADRSVSVRVEIKRPELRAKGMAASDRVRPLCLFALSCLLMPRPGEPGSP